MDFRQGRYRLPADVRDLGPWVRRLLKIRLLAAGELTRSRFLANRDLDLVGQVHGGVIGVGYLKA
jgi:hypothetical protein